jgi:hypothetical protein
MARASRAEWAMRVERWKASGLTAKEFAAETGLKASTLTFWSWKLRREASGQDDQRGAPRRRRAKSARVQITSWPLTQPLEVPQEYWSGGVRGRG